MKLLVQQFRRRGIFKDITVKSAKKNITQFYQLRHHVNLTLIGPPGAGKGTYGKLLMQDFNHSQSLEDKSKHHPFILSAGDVLRNHVINNTEIGQKVSECQRSGKLADDNLVSRALLEDLHGRTQYMNSSDTKFTNLGFILDGYPRTIKQAENVSPQTSKSTPSGWPSHLQIHYAVSVEVPFFVCKPKILGRRKCNECGESFNINCVDQDGFYMPALLPECSCFESAKDTDFNQSKWDMRSDDTEDILEARYNEFLIETEPVIQYYEQIGRLIRFIPYKGVQDVDKLRGLVRQKLMNQ